MDNVKVLLQALPYLKRFRDKVFVVKVGGEIARTPEALDPFAQDIAMLSQLGICIVVVHGGGPQLDEVAGQIGVESQKVDGRRITDDKSLELAKMVFAGSINTDILAALRSHGGHPVGLSGLDGEVLTAKRRPPREITDPKTGETRTVDFQNVGDIGACNPALLYTLVENRYVPVVSSLGCDDSGAILNINADTVACKIAASMDAAKLLILTNTNGLLKDIDDPDSRYSHLTLKEAEAMIDAGDIRGGMAPKIGGVIEAVRGGVKRAYIINGLVPHALLTEIFTRDGQGTMLLDKAGEADYLERG